MCGYLNTVSSLCSKPQSTQLLCSALQTLPRLCKSLGAHLHLPKAALSSLSPYCLNIPSLPALPSAICTEGHTCTDSSWGTHLYSCWGIHLYSCWGTHLHRCWDRKAKCSMLSRCLSPQEQRVHCWAHCWALLLCDSAAKSGWVSAFPQKLHVPFIRRNARLPIILTPLLSPCKDIFQRAVELSPKVTAVLCLGILAADLAQHRAQPFNPKQHQKGLGGCDTFQAGGLIYKGLI